MNLPPGYTSRPANRQELEDIVALMDVWDFAYFGESGPNRAELQYTWGGPLFELERDTRTIHAADGTIVAYAEHSSPDPAQRFEARGCVHPDHEGRGIGSAMISWTEEQTRSRLEVGASSARLWNSTGAPNVSGLQLFEERGYRPIRTFWQMRIDLDPSFEAGPVPHDVTIRSHVEGVDDRGAYEAMEEAFASHFGWVHEPFEEWLAHQQADGTWDPSLGTIAEVDGEIVGASINGEIDGVGWIYELGVRQAWQGRGIGRTLLRHALASFAVRGVPVARLGVDTENESGALELYRSEGMRPVREWRLFEKSIEAI